MQIDPSLPASIHVLGLDGIAGPCRISRVDQLVTVVRNRDESGHVYLVWPTAEWGELVLVTGTLPESDREVPVALELARGTANRLRNQISLWEEGGLSIPGEIHESAGRASQLLASSIMQASTSGSELSSIRSIEVAVRGIFELSRVFARQILPLRLQNPGTPKVWTGIRCEESRQFELVRSEFDVVSTTSPEIAADRRMVPLAIGPLVDMAPGALPEAIRGIDRFEARQAAILQSAKKVLDQSRQSNVRMIHAVAGLNGTGHRHMGYSQQLQLTLDLLQMCEDNTGKAPVMVSFDNPWGERLARSVGGTHPLQIADTLLRRGVRISVLGLEINLDYGHRGSFARDPFQWLELLDLWGQLGLPLVLLLRVPFGVPAENTAIRHGMTDRQRMEYLLTVLPLVLSRPVVQGVLWQQLQDESGETGFPGGGVLAIDGTPKPVWDLLAGLRRQVLDSCPACPAP